MFVAEHMNYLALKDVCCINMGQSPDSKSYNDSKEGIPFFQGNADFGERYPITRVWCNAPTKIAEKDDILISVRAPIGALNYAKETCCIGRGLAAITPNKTKVSTEFIFWLLKEKNNELNRLGTGSTFKAISKKILEETKVPDISLEKQTAYSNILEKLYSIITHLRTQLEKLDLLVKARFVEMFGNPIANSMNWAQPELKECLESIDNGKSYICNTDSRVDNSPAILKLSAVTYGIYKPNENKSMIDKELFDKNIEVKDCDLLFTRKNTPELVGMSAYVFSTPQKLMMPDLIFRINTKTMCNKIYLWQLINHDLFRPCIQNIANGSAKSMSNISKERLSHLTIPLPPIELQTQFADFVKQVDQSKSILQQELDKAQMLFDSLMQEYFG